MLGQYTKRHIGTSSVGLTLTVTPFPSFSQTLVGEVQVIEALGGVLEVGGGREVSLRTP